MARSFCCNPYCGAIGIEHRVVSHLSNDALISRGRCTPPRMTAAQFLAEAWKMANEKARELGWSPRLGLTSKQWPRTKQHRVAEPLYK